MKNKQDVRHFYTERVGELSDALAVIQKKIKLISFWRIIIFTATIIGIYVAAGRSLIALLIITVVGFFIFFVLIYKHAVLFPGKINTESLLSINENELLLLNRDTSNQHDGLEYINQEHPFALDLDIFGRRSLFQFIDRNATIGGREHLAATLLNPLAKVSQLIERQQAIEELKNLPLWRQEFQALGGPEVTDRQALERLIKWSRSSIISFNKPIYKIMLWVNPIIAFSIITLITLGILNELAFWIILLIPGIIFGNRLKLINQEHDLLGKQAALLKKYAALFKKTEEQNFKSIILKEVQKTLSSSKISAQAAFTHLSKIMKSFDHRLNMIAGVLLNIFFLWDIRQIIRLEKWKKQNASEMPRWFEALSEIDELASFAGFAFNHPDAVVPIASEHSFTLKADNLKHPFIPEEKCVGNPVQIPDWHQFHIITGANMAGKSTYLRTVGINLVLAECGAPVLADSFEFSPVQVFTGIKTSDSLQDGASYFFAELKRLKEIMDRLREGEKLFIILDEILRGTNSKDKQKGSMALLRQLIQYHASGLIATHDLTLGDLAKEFPQEIQNKRFEVEIENDEMTFDYTLKEGISQNLNATFLLKKMRIAGEEE
ncbi:MAG: hypothetical protein IH595_13805 [Bacteroidales bacterium]|nr:hypothetical protein [Bacteroidales bacterium]